MKKTFIKQVLLFCITSLAIYKFNPQYLFFLHNCFPIPFDWIAVVLGLTLTLLATKEQELQSPIKNDQEIFFVGAAIALLAPLLILMQSPMQFNNFFSLGFFLVFFIGLRRLFRFGFRDLTITDVFRHFLGQATIWAFIVIVSMGIFEIRIQDRNNLFITNPSFDTSSLNLSEIYPAITIPIEFRLAPFNLKDLPFEEDSKVFLVASVYALTKSSIGQNFSSYTPITEFDCEIPKGALFGQKQSVNCFLFDSPLLKPGRYVMVIKPKLLFRENSILAARGIDYIANMLIRFEKL